METQAAFTIFDAAAHPTTPTGDEIRPYMDYPWRSMYFPGPERYQYASPYGDYLPDATPADGLAGSDRSLLHSQLLDGTGASAVLLLPLTRGVLPNADLGSQICSATNEWLASEWLNDAEGLLGTIRVNPSDPVAAVAEIERWASHPRMVQVAVPLQSQHPYGQRQYFPIWEAAAAHALPVAIHVDGGASVEFNPSAAGPLRYALEYRTLLPLTAAYHLASFVGEGVLQRLPEFRVVFADGGLSMLVPIIWRLDKDWRSTRVEIPWATQLPSEYLRQHVRFCLHRADLPRAPSERSVWWEMAWADEVLIFASNYPQSDCLRPDEVIDHLTPDIAGRVLSKTASDLYTRASIHTQTKETQS
jgi:uncharacterized protein